MKYMNIILVLMATVLQQCHRDAPFKNGSNSVDHDQWSALLQKHVDEGGYVNYKGFQKDSISLNAYLEELTTNPPDENAWSTKEQLAYWINAYNAFTVKLIMDHYPLESIKDIGSAIQIPFINSPWDIKFIKINGEKLDLNNIEHSILRKKFNEPRIHFAINCASFSCPKLRQEAFVADKLDAQLEEQSIDFINDSERNIISKNHAEISKIFSWFKGDFTKNGSLIDFLNKYAKNKMDKKVKIFHKEYNWSLNERGMPGAN